MIDVILADLINNEQAKLYTLSFALSCRIFEIHILDYKVIGEIWHHSRNIGRLIRS